MKHLIVGLNPATVVAAGVGAPVLRGRSAWRIPGRCCKLCVTRSVVGGVLVVMTPTDRDRDNAIDAARGAASHAHMIIDRVFRTDGGFVGRVESDDFADSLTCGCQPPS